ncbi:hypothetical protein NL108_000081 [Boleophthalmus pectinirostris]|nr:hypothetical protein NL108_000081 [Boleophthalmus pectinirostris]
MEEKPYCCDLCGHSFSQLYHLKRQQKIHTGERPHNCDQCGASFKEAYALMELKDSHNTDKPYKCDTCEEAFADRLLLWIHRRLHRELYLRCDKCHKEFASVASLSRHKLRHSKDLFFPCNVCNKALWSREAFLRHQKKHFSSPSVVYPCGQCGKRLATLRALEVHQNHSCTKASLRGEGQTAYTQPQKPCTTEEGLRESGLFLKPTIISEQKKLDESALFLRCCNENRIRL